MVRTKLMKPEFEKDVVYLVQIPRAGSCPSLSPFCLKLETWIRMAGIRYQNVDNKLTNQSSKGQIPFVELNGKEINDTNFIIGELTRYFGRENMESYLNVEQQANLHTYLRMTEESLRWLIVVDRSKNAKVFISDEAGMGRSISCPKKFLLRIVGLRFLQRGMRGTVQKQGYGRFSDEELGAVGKSDLKALDGFLAKKRYFFGDKPTRLDAAVFGTVGELLYVPMTNDTIPKFIQMECPNLNAFMARVKAEYWPDWDEILKTGSMNTTYNDNFHQNRGFINPAHQDTTTKL